MKTFDDNVHEKFMLLEKMIIRKQKDYGPTNIMKTPPSITPEQGLLLRMNDKVQRFGNLLMTGATPENESLIDTAMDIANYGVILWCVLEGSFELPLKETVEQNVTEKKKKVARNARRKTSTTPRNRSGNRH